MSKYNDEELNKVEAEGQEACKAGISRQENPYRSTVEQCVWSSGWMSARIAEILFVASKFAVAGDARDSILESELAMIGLKKQKTYKSLRGRTLYLQGGWEQFCIFVYEKMTGKHYPGCPYKGTGFRSQWFGELCHKAISENMMNLIDAKLTVQKES